MKRREFVLTGSIGVATLAFRAEAQGGKEYVCPPCGCSNDGRVFDQPGKCSACGMGLVEARALNELAGISNFFKVSNQVWTGGQPTMEHLGKLKDEGIRVIINLRPHSESNNLGVNEAAKVKDLGLSYFNVPVDFGDLRPEAADEFLRITDAQLKRGPVFIHCAAGIRVGGFWMIRRVLRDGWEFDKALAEATQIGLGNLPPLIDFAKQYIEKHRTR